MARPLLGGLGRRRLPKFAIVAVATLAPLPLSASAQTDPRIGLAPGDLDWSEATRKLDLIANPPRAGAFDALPGNFGFVNSGLAFTGNVAIAGNFNGFPIYAFFDRGPVSGTSLALGGLWSTYWYNGHVFGTEIARGSDVFALRASDQLSQNEIAAASQVQLTEFNAQVQPQITWNPSFAVFRSRFDQVVRADGITPAKAAKVAKHIDRPSCSPEDQCRGRPPRSSG